MLLFYEVGEVGGNLNTCWSTSGDRQNEPGSPAAAERGQESRTRCLEIETWRVEAMAT